MSNETEKNLGTSGMSGMVTDNVDDEEEPSNADGGGFVDPLASRPQQNTTGVNEAETSSTATAEETETFEIDGAVMQQHHDPTQYTEEELLEILSKTTVVDMNHENMDPIEWSVRKLFPLPAVYYWDLLEGQPEDVKKEIVETKIPLKIRLWHRLVASLDRAQHVINDWVAQPIAGTLGITDSRFSYVLDNMTDEELRTSKRIVAERKKKQEQQKQMEEAT
eukprot:CAMPEP_0198137818 /NCGR_PEP_ID=MMETSP1443-20131203/1281_1 /TAXON_ID=186043 /ORGANISM="Entomoneis sp., Strain CCMP2396" /LENGTH=220 /DNA_ID=CAMNT_0043799377 /DNA_START=771 /DNA_END=1433 /DNA_ORIENTATION=+